MGFDLSEEDTHNPEVHRKKVHEIMVIGDYKDHVNRKWFMMLMLRIVYYPDIKSKKVPYTKDTDFKDYPKYPTHDNQLINLGYPILRTRGEIKRNPLMRIKNLIRIKKWIYKIHNYKIDLT